MVGRLPCMTSVDNAHEPRTGAHSTGSCFGRYEAREAIRNEYTEDDNHGAGAPDGP